MGYVDANTSTSQQSKSGIGGNNGDNVNNGGTVPAGFFGTAGTVSILDRFPSWLLPTVVILILVFVGFLILRRK